jgi:hypothetical protein
MEHPSSDAAEPGPDDPRDRVARTDRLVARTVPLVLLVALGALWAVSAGHVLPTAAPVAALVVYALAKVAVAIPGALAGWKPWPALVVEAGALLVVAAIVWTATHEPVYLIVVAALLMLGGFWRVRAARETEEE